MLRLKSLFAAAAPKINDCPDRGLLERFQEATGAVNLYFFRRGHLHNLLSLSQTEN